MIAPRLFRTLCAAFGKACAILWLIFLDEAEALGRDTAHRTLTALRGMRSRALWA